MQRASNQWEVLWVDTICVVCDQNKNLYVLSSICTITVYISAEAWSIKMTELSPE